MANLRLEVLFTDGTEDFIILQPKFDWLGAVTDTMFMRSVVAELKYQMLIADNVDDTTEFDESVYGSDEFLSKPRAVPKSGEEFSLLGFRQHLSNQDTHSLSNLEAKYDKIAALVVRWNLPVNERGYWLSKFELSGKHSLGVHPQISFYSTANTGSPFKFGQDYDTIANRGHRFTLESDVLYMTLRPEHVNLYLEVNNEYIPGPSHAVMRKPVN